MIKAIKEKNDICRSGKKMKTMRVAVYYKNNDVRIEEVPIPIIKNKELLIRIHASGICGSDVMEWYRLKKTPRVLGHETAGDIVKVGKDVKKYKLGDRVFVSHHVPCNTCRYCLNNQHTLCDTLHSTNFYPGGFAQYLRIPEINVDRGVFVLPDELSYEEGVFIEPLACVVRGLRISEMKPGQTILIIGSGVSGLLHIKLARAWGISRIIAVDINDYRLEAAKKFGADKTIHARENIPNKVKKLNDGNLADLVIICTGAPSVLPNIIDSVERGGTLLLFAPTKPGIEISLPLFDFWNKGVKMVSTYAGSPLDITMAIEHIKSKKVTVTDMITHKLPLAETQEGFKLVAKAQNSIKVIIEPQK